MCGLYAEVADDLVVFVAHGYVSACKELGVVRATVGLYLTPIVGVVFAAVFLGERPTPMSTFGGLCIIIGVAIANWRKK